MSGYVHIYRPECITKHATSGKCPDCKQRTRFLILTFEWHGERATCMKCGRSFEDGEWLPLPFERGARAKEIARAKQSWRDAKPIGVEEMLRRAAS